MSTVLPVADEVCPSLAGKRFFVIDVIFFASFAHPLPTLRLNKEYLTAKYAKDAQGAQRTGKTPTKF